MFLRLTGIILLFVSIGISVNSNAQDKTKVTEAEAVAVKSLIKIQTKDGKEFWVDAKDLVQLEENNNDEADAKLSDVKKPEAKPEPIETELEVSTPAVAPITKPTNTNTNVNSSVQITTIEIPSPAPQKQDALKQEDPIAEAPKTTPVDTKEKIEQENQPLKIKKIEVSETYDNDKEHTLDMIPAHKIEDEKHLESGLVAHKVKDSKINLKGIFGLGSFSNIGGISTNYSFGVSIAYELTSNLDLEAQYTYSEYKDGYYNYDYFYGYVGGETFDQNDFSLILNYKVLKSRSFNIALRNGFTYSYRSANDFYYGGSVNSDTYSLLFGISGDIRVANNLLLTSSFDYNLSVTGSDYDYFSTSPLNVVSGEDFYTFNFGLKIEL